MQSQSKLIFFYFIYGIIFFAGFTFQNHLVERNFYIASYLSELLVPAEEKESENNFIKVHIGLN